MKIAMIGTGYVGLVSGVCFSDFGHDVVCVDRMPEKIAMLERGEVPIFEPGLDALMEKNVDAGRLSFTTDLANAVDGADAVFIAVGTPTRRGDGHADLTYVMAAAEEVRKGADRLLGDRHQIDRARGHQPPRPRGGGRGQPDSRVRRGVEPRVPARGRGDRGFHEARPRGGGRAVGSRGGGDGRDLPPAICASFPILTTDLESAEMIKYAANAFLATKISFINEIAALCERAGADVKEVARGMGLDGRIGNKFLHAGPGYGGSCFPKDTSALARIGQEHAVPQTIVETVIRVNDGGQAADDREAARSLRRQLQRQDDRGAGRDLQAQHRRHARGPVAHHRARAVGGGAKVRVVDPQGRREGEALLPA